MTFSSDITAEHARAAAEIEADVGVEQVADIYADALLGVAEKAGRTKAVLEEFDTLVGEVYARFPKLEAILGSALVSHEEKLEILDRVLGGKVSREFLDFLKVVSRHGRLDIACGRFSARRGCDTTDLRGQVRVCLTTATPLDQRPGSTTDRKPSARCWVASPWWSRSSIPR